MSHRHIVNLASPSPGRNPQVLIIIGTACYQETLGSKKVKVPGGKASGVL